ncbi:MAG: ECF transporter S component [Anaeroplasmataceae bacterium]
MNNSQKLLNKVIIIAMFSALSCAGTFVQIRMPAGDFVHLGNFVMITAALLLGGIEGGLVGSLGMGIYDLIFYTSKPSTIIRTFVLKFLIGFVVGTLFRYVLKKDKNVKIPLYVVGGVFLALFITSIVFIALGTNSGFSSIYSVSVFGTVKKLTISYYIPIFAFIFAAGLIVAAVFSHKLSKRNQAALFAITIAVLLNIVGEFFLRWLLEGIMLDGFKVSLATATSKIPGSLITGFISVVLSVLIYEPIYRALKNNDSFADDTAQYDNKTSEVE